MRFEEFIERTCRTLLDFDDTLVPGRARERLPMRALASIARMLPAP